MDTTKLAEARELERNARREFAWSRRSTEWPHHRQDYARHGNELWKQAEELRRQAGAPLLQYPGAQEYTASGTLTEGGDAKQAPGDSLSGPTLEEGDAQ